MNVIYNQIKEIQDSITELKFNTVCNAVCGKYSVPIKIEVDGLEEHTKCEDTINKVRDIAAINFMTEAKASDVDRSVRGLDKYPDECKAWSIAILWFAFATTTPCKRRDEWMSLYRKWDRKYSSEYKDKAMRNKLLCELGLPERWTRRASASRSKINVKLNRILGEA